MSETGSPKVRGSKKPVSKGSLVDVKTLIKHPMESGFRKDKATGETIPAYFIEKVVVEYGGKEVMHANWTGAVSKNPFFSFSVRAEATGPLKVTWKDNKGESWTASTDIEVA